MKKLNQYGLGLAFALSLILSSVLFAQTITQGEQEKTTESCCAMACCSHDSSSMKNAKDHSSKHEGRCSGDSCEMKSKENMKNHTAAAGCCCCSGDSCDMKMKDGAKNHAAEAGCCCCSGDSCEMDIKDMKHKEKTN